MTVEITPAPLCGKVFIPPSKSAAHRLILGAALAKGTSRVEPACHSKDIDATLKAAAALGAEITEQNGAFYITGIGGRPQSGSPVTIDCGESGSTLRFLLPIAAALGRTVTFTGHGRLPQRPMREMTELLRRHGVQCSADLLPITVTGRLNPGVFKISGAVSSQHLTGLLLALPLIGPNSSAELTTPLQSAGYIDLTVQALAEFGVTVTAHNGVYQTTGSYRAKDVEIEGDWSQASFYLAAAAMGARLQLIGLNPRSAQGDKAGLALFAKFGVQPVWQGQTLHLEKAPQPLNGEAGESRVAVALNEVGSPYVSGKNIDACAQRKSGNNQIGLAADSPATGSLKAAVQPGGGSNSPTASSQNNGPTAARESANTAEAARTIDCRNIPDMVPALAAAAMFAAGQTVLTHAERLRFKESDRLATTAAAVNALGGKAEQTADGLIIYPVLPKGGQVCGANDHRIVMAFSVAAAYAAGKTQITTAEATEKSYPNFFKDFTTLGGKANVLNLWN